MICRAVLTILQEILACLNRRIIGMILVFVSVFLVGHPIHARDYADDAYSAMEKALQSHVQALELPYDGVFTTRSVTDTWAVGNAGYVFQDTNEPVPTGYFVVLARRFPDNGWRALVPSTEDANEYNTWLAEIPVELIGAEEKAILHVRVPGTGTHRASVSGYRLPWAGGWGATLTKGPHSGGSHAGLWAWDFDLWQGQWSGMVGEPGHIVASKGGVVVFAKDAATDDHHCDNSSCAGWANVVIIEHSPNEYSWYYHLQHDSIPEAVKQARRDGTSIEAGTIIGIEGRTGWSEGIHLHFMASDGVPDLSQYDENDADRAPWPTQNNTLEIDFEDWDEQQIEPYSGNYLDPTNAVILYWDADYKGPAVRLAEGNLNFRQCSPTGDGQRFCVTPTFLDNKISSIRVTPQGELFVKFHQDPNGGGCTRGWWWTEANFDNDTYDPNTFGCLMTSLNDSISSVHIDCDPCSNTGSSTLPFSGDWLVTQSDPPLPLCGGTEPPPSTDNATFVSDITLPDDGPPRIPGESLTKVWRVRNTGTSTWNSSYQLVFTGGEQMGAPSTVNVPGTVTPGVEVDLSVPMTAPNEPGVHRGDWRLRNAQGVFFGEGLWVIVQIPDDGAPTPPPPPSGSSVELTCSDCPATVEPGQTFRPTIRATVNSGQLLKSRGDLLRNTDGNLYDAWPHIAVEHDVNTGGTYDFTFYADDPLRAPDQEGTYETKWRVWRDGHWDGDEITIRFTVQQSGGTNYPPNPPDLTGPGDWAIFQGNPVILTAQHNGDPDGDAITHYYFELLGPNPGNSGWISSNTWNPTGLPYSNYEWRVKVRDSRGAESSWSPQTWHFNVLNNEPEIYDFYHTTCRDAWGGPEKICFCASTNAGTLQLQVNTATDGSDSGEWRIINELGVPEYRCVDDSDRPPNTNNLEWETGTHRVRLYARREGGWENAAYQDIMFSLPAERRPDDPGKLLPANNACVNSKTVRFDWCQYSHVTGPPMFGQAGPLILRRSVNFPRRIERR